MASLAAAADRYQASEPHMGTLVTITLYAETPDQAQRGFVAAFSRIRALDAILSDYKPDSELSRVCSLKMPLSPELATVIAQAQRISSETDGAFDITAGPVTRLWREARSRKQLPAPGAVREALRRTGFRKLVVSGDKVTCSVEGMQLDAGGIAKGYAADEALRVLRGAGIRSALIAVSGDIAAGDPPPGKTGWRVQVQDQVLTLTDASVSTSGDEFQFVEIDGVRYSHVIDPRTGMPVRDGKTVSVIARRGIEADARATALSVSGSAERRIVDLR